MVEPRRYSEHDTEILFEHLLRTGVRNQNWYYIKQALEVRKGGTHPDHVFRVAQGIYEEMAPATIREEMRDAAESLITSAMNGEYDSERALRDAVRQYAEGWAQGDLNTASVLLYLPNHSDVERQAQEIASAAIWEAIGIQGFVWDPASWTKEEDEEE